MSLWAAAFERLRARSRKNQEKATDARVLVVLQGGLTLSVEPDERVRYVANNLIRGQNGRSA